MLTVLAQPSAIVPSDKAAKPLQAWMIWSARLQVGENLAQRQTCDRPIVRTLLQHQPRVAHRPAYDFIYETVVHRGVRCLSVGENTEEAAAKTAPLTSWGKRPDMAQRAQRHPNAMGSRARSKRVNLGSENRPLGRAILTSEPRSPHAEAR